MGIKLDSNFNEVEAAEGGGYTPPTPGGYVLRVLDVSSKDSKAGNPMIALSLDIAEGQFKGAFAKFPRKFFQLVTGDSTPFFKGMLKSFKESNPEQKIRGIVAGGEFHPELLKDLLIGGCLREAEYRDKEGQVKIGLEVAFLCAAGKVSDVNPPALKKLNGATHGDRRMVGPAGNSVNDDDIPF